MAKIIDITEKLSLEKPQIKIRDVILTVNDEAMTMLEIMPLLDGKMDAESINRICKTIFLFEITMSLVSGDSEEGETATPATT